MRKANYFEALLAKDLTIEEAEALVRHLKDEDQKRPIHKLARAASAFCTSMQRPEESQKTLAQALNELESAAFDFARAMGWGPIVDGKAGYPHKR